MKKTCPECGSNEIIPDLLVFADEALTGLHPPYVKLVEPSPAKKPFIWIPKKAASGFRAEVCGECGHTRFRATNHAELAKAHKQGYVSEQFALKDVLSI
jgi:hypothetical protein